MNNRIDQRFLQLRKEGTSGFMAYITGGDPTPEKTVDIAGALSEAGVDFLEIGIPFSDPLADGVANQLGAQRALTAGTTVRKLLKTIAEIRKNLDFPIILYSYLNSNDLSMMRPMQGLMACCCWICHPTKLW
jgi:tryptophan synthase alpha chain